MKLVGKAILEDGTEIIFEPKNVWVGDEFVMNLPGILEYAEIQQKSKTIFR